MEKGICHKNGEKICPHGRLRILDCTDPGRPHHDGYGPDWDRRYERVMTALVSKISFAEHEKETLVKRVDEKGWYTLSHEVG